MSDLEQTLSIIKPDAVERERKREKERERERQKT
jgi:nucleoside diphosphate kinase